MLIYDGDELLYLSCRVTQVETAFKGVEQYHADVKSAFRIAVSKIDAALEMSGCKEVHLAFSDKKNFRKHIAQSYKENRKNVGKPAGYYELLAALECEYRSFRYPFLEADDVMGILSENYECLASADKDMDTIAGISRVNTYALNRLRDDSYRSPLSELEADRNLFFQTLTGDSTDGFKGCPGIGKKKAEKALADMETTEEGWEIVKELYESKGQEEADALIQMRLARILRPGEYDFIDEYPITVYPC